MLRRLTLFLIIIACAYAPAIYSAAPISPQEQAAWAASNAPENLEYNIYFHIIDDWILHIKEKRFARFFG